MPTYDFRCPDGHEFERFFRKISDAVAELPCPACGKTATRQLSGGAGLLFKGSGFYLTDYGKNAHRKSGTGSGGGSGGGSGAGEAKGGDAGSKSESGGAAKPAEGASGGSGSSTSSGSSPSSGGSSGSGGGSTSDG